MGFYLREAGRCVDIGNDATIWGSLRISRSLPSRSAYCSRLVLFRTCLLAGRNWGSAKTQEAAADRRLVRAAERRPAGKGGALPAAAADHPGPRLIGTAPG